MKNLFVLLALVFLCCTSVPFRNVTANTSITTADDGGIITNTGGAITVSFGTVSSGFTCTVNNFGTGVLTFGSAVTVGNGQTITLLPKYSTEFNPGIHNGNSIRLFYDGSVWRGF